jgi:hypothetical protein
VESHSQYFIRTNFTRTSERSYQLQQKWWLRLCDRGHWLRDQRSRTIHHTRPSASQFHVSDRVLGVYQRYIIQSTECYVAHWQSNRTSNTGETSLQIRDELDKSNRRNRSRRRAVPNSHVNRSSCQGVNQFLCARGSCVAKSRVCDMTDDCGDHSDESSRLCASYQTCTFDVSFCDWRHDNTTEFKWELVKGPSPSDLTGVGDTHLLLEVFFECRRSPLA